MTTLPKYLAASLTTFFETRIVKIALHACLPVSLPAWFWELTAEDGRQFRGQNIVLAMPVPQAVMLIEASQELFEKLSTASFNTDAFEKIKAVQFDPCLAVLAELSSSSKVPAPGFIELKRVESTASDVLAFLGDNHQKGISAVHTVTLHATPEWSKTYFDAPETEITHSLIQAAAPWIDSSHVVSTQLMRWRYSQVRGCAVNSSISPTLFPEGFCMLCTQPALLLAGDGFGGSRIETAILSGLSVGKALTKNACLGLI